MSPEPQGTRGFGHDGAMVGRRAGHSDTRRLIEQAARELFAARGYERTTIRAVAEQAGVDPRLVTHFYGSKQRLFVAITQPPTPAGDIVALMTAGDPALAMAEAISQRLTNPAYVQTLLGLIRAAATEELAAKQVADLLAKEVIEPLIQGIGTDDARLQVHTVAALIAGIVFARDILDLEVLKSADAESLVRAFVPLLQGIGHQEG